MNDWFSIAVCLVCTNVLVEAAVPRGSTEDVEHAVVCVNSTSDYGTENESVEVRCFTPKTSTASSRTTSKDTTTTSNGIMTTSKGAETTSKGAETTSKGTETTSKGITTTLKGNSTTPKSKSNPAGILSVFDDETELRSDEESAPDGAINATIIEYPMTFTDIETPSTSLPTTIPAITPTPPDRDPFSLRNAKYSPDLEAYVVGDMLFEPETRQSDYKFRLIPALWNSRVAFSFGSGISLKERLLVDATVADFNARMRRVMFYRSSIITRNDYVEFTKRGNLTYSYIGKKGGKQRVNFAASETITMNKIRIMMMHVLGFFHEQNRPDRDNFIEIVKDNIKPGYEIEFFRAPEALQPFFGSHYDYESITHFTSETHAKNSNEPTMVPKYDWAKPEDLGRGQKNSFTDSDIEKITNLYDWRF